MRSNVGKKLDVPWYMYPHVAAIIPEGCLTGYLLIFKPQHKGGGLQETIFQLPLIPQYTSDLASACIFPLKQLVPKT